MKLKVGISYLKGKSTIFEPQRPSAYPLIMALLSAYLGVLGMTGLTA